MSGQNDRTKLFQDGYILADETKATPLLLMAQSLLRIFFFEEGENQVIIFTIPKATNITNEIIYGGWSYPSPRAATFRCIRTALSHRLG